MGTDRPRARALMARWLAGFIAIAVIVAILTSVLLWVAGGMRPLPVTYGRTAIGVLGLVVAPITFAAVGWLLATRVPGNPTGWLFVIVAVAVGLMFPTNLLVGSATETLKPASPVVIWVAWIRQVFSVPVTLMSLTIAALIFPTGRALPGWWRWTVPAGVLAGSLLAVSTALDPRGLYSYPSFPNPTSLPIEWEWLVTATRIGAAVLQAGCIVLAVVSVVLRYRGGSDATRAQLRWIALGVGIAGFGSIPYLVARFIIRMPNDLGEFVSAIAQMGICAFPIAAAFAISRYRLWDVDLLIGRTLVYVPLSAACGGLYSAGIALFQRLFVVVTGETSDSAIVLAVLVVATAFTPLRRWLESLVEHRFPAAQPAARPAVVDRPVATSDPSPVKPTTDKAPRVRQVRPRRADRVGAVTAALDAAPAVRALHLQEVGDDGTIDCPLYGRRAAQACLDCPNFTSVVREPRLTVICSRPA